MAKGTVMVVVFVGWSTAIVSHQFILYPHEQIYNKVDKKAIVAAADNW